MKSRLKQRIFALSLLAWTAVCPADAQQTRSLRDQFLSPSDEAKPWTFWYWMYGAVSKEGITADLEAMKRAGLGGTYLMPIKGIHEGAQYDGKAQQLTPEWWEMVRFSMEEADRLGLKLGMHICDGFALAGGPWITPEESMQKVVWSDTIVNGGKLMAIRLPQPKAYENYYEDIALFALPVEDAADEMQAKITCVNLATTGNVKAAQTVNMDAAGVIRSSLFPRLKLAVCPNHGQRKVVGHQIRGVLAGQTVEVKERAQGQFREKAVIGDDAIRLFLCGHGIERHGDPYGPRPFP